MTPVPFSWLKIFGIYGLPRAIYVDNGNPWANASNKHRHTRFSAWLLRHDVDVIFGRPYHPQGRGKLERFHRTLKLEVLQGRSMTSLQEAQGHFDPWREVYNLERPHEALDLGTPAEHYRVSEREFVEQKEEYQYSDRYQIRRVNPVGQFRFRGQVYRVREAFQDQPIGLSETQTEGVWDVTYCRFVVASLNIRTGTIERHQPRG
ncbi:integrase core domain-containing protein [Neorhodopirellula lusitana]|nr:integrase core domain-containing protein [Neorhodopirellula lusitana]